MKITLVPEEIILEHLENHIKGNPNKKLKFQKYFRHLPEKLEVTQEFIDQWSPAVSILVKKLIVDTFGVHSFLYEEDGIVKRCSVLEQEFWQQIDFKFSFRAIDRVWEEIKFPFTDIQPIYQLVLPADALLLSIIMDDFDKYNFKWLSINKAHWVIKVVFIALSKDYSPLPGWLSLLEKPEKLELPVRGFLIHRSADYMAYLNQLISKLMEYKQVDDTELRKLGERLDKPGVPIDLRFHIKEVYSAFEIGRKFIDAFQIAFKSWNNEFTLALDDERYLRGLYNSTGLENEIREFERQIEEYNEMVDLQEVVNESLVFN